MPNRIGCKIDNVDTDVTQGPFAAMRCGDAKAMSGSCANRPKSCSARGLEVARLDMPHLSQPAPLHQGRDPLNT